jgi:hypothetical protein
VIFRKPGLSEGAFMMNNNVPGDTIVQLLFSEIKNGTGANWDSQNNIGQVAITNLDRENRRVSGTFSATLVLNATSGGGSYPAEINITDGKIENVSFLFTD